MKRLFYLLLLLPFLSLAQVATGYEQQFDYGLQNLAPQTVTSPVYLGTVGADGTMGQTLSSNFTAATKQININGNAPALSESSIEYRVAQADTGVLKFAGLATNSATTINIGAVEGYVVDNESTPEAPGFAYVNYAGQTNVTVTSVGVGEASYVMLSSLGVVSFQNTFPTSAERKAKIWLGKVSHPGGSITLVVNEPDYITSPLAFSRDWFQDLGPYVNNGVYPYANGTNLNINITAGTITGDGINFVVDRTNPNRVAMGPSSVQSFTYRSQTGVGGATTTVTPDFYDLAGTPTAIAGSSNQATIQYFFALPGIGYVAQLGQTVYATFSEAVAALGKESFVRYPSFTGNVVPIAALVVTKGCTALNNPLTAKFFNANKNGDFFGASAGTSTATLQSAYNNSVEPEILTDSTHDGFTIKRGSAADTDNIIAGQNGAGTITTAIDGNGKATFATVYSNGSVSATSANARGNYFTNALTATANGDNLTCLDLSPTFTNGAFTSVKNNIIKAAWNTSNFSVNDLNAGSVMMYSVSSPSISNYFSLATTTSYTVNAPSTAGSITFAQGNSYKARFMPTTGNLTLQNGGSLSDAGYRLDVFDNTRLNGSLTLSTAPTTSAGSYDIITRNSSTGVIEKQSSLVLITITTAVSITTATTDSNSVGQNGRHVVIDNGVNAINLTCNGGVTTSYGKIGSGAITFVQGSGRTLVQLSGTAILNGITGSTATIWSSGTTDYLAITNY